MAECFDTHNDDKNDKHKGDILGDKPTHRSHRSGNTFRLTGTKHVISRPTLEAEIESDHGSFVERFDGSIEFPVTSCDVEFNDYYDHLQKSLGRNYSTRWFFRGLSTSYSLGKAESWNMVDFLEKNAAKKRTTSSLSAGNIETKTFYELPIVGKLKIDVPKYKVETNEDEKERMITIDGRHYSYDLDVIHRISGKSIGGSIRYNFADIPTGVNTIGFDVKSSATLAGLTPKAAIINNRKTWDKVANKLVDQRERRSGMYMYGAHSYVGIDTLCWARATSDKRASVVLDMGANMKVKYISTMGRPLTTYTFPQRDRNPGYTKAQYERPIVVTDDGNDRDFVKRFTLHGRVDGGAWVNIGTYDGNTDRLTEKLNDVSRNIPDGYAPRYLKFTPIDVEGDGCVRFMLYGDVADLTVESSVTTDVPECVTYTVTHRTSQPFSRDGCSTSCCRCEWCLGSKIDQGDNMRNLKRNLNKFVKEYNSDPLSVEFFGD